MKVVGILSVLFLSLGCSSVAENLQVDNRVPQEFLPYLEAVNEARSEGQMCGSRYFSAVAPLRWNSALYIAAYEHSYDMAYSNTFDHLGSGESTDRAGSALGKRSSMEDRIHRQGYRYRSIGENLGAGTNLSTAQGVVTQLLTSSGHCANIMHPDFTEMGMAMIKNDHARYTHYWTQVFGKPQE